jgi:hypothetical protein
MALFMLALTLFLSCVAADAAGSQQPLPAEHRGEPRSAEPFLDRIASLFGGGSAAAEKESAQPPRPAAGPVYRPPQGPPPGKYQTAASQQRPVAVLPPLPQQPPRKQGYGGGPLLQTGASNLSPVSQPGESNLL